MPRYIDADALRLPSELPVDPYDDPYFRGMYSGWNNAIRECKDLIDSAPTVSPDEVRGVGKWTNRRTIEHDGEYWCTACGKEITIYMGVDRKDRYNYCPNCGAKMEVSEDA